jgi:hypothetical protein
MSGLDKLRPPLRLNLCFDQHDYFPFVICDRSFARLGRKTNPARTMVLLTAKAPDFLNAVLSRLVAVDSSTWQLSNVGGFKTQPISKPVGI